MSISRVPAGEDWITRKFRELGEAVQVLRSAVAGISAIRDQIEFLAGQTVSAESVPGTVTTRSTNPATAAVADTWVPFDDTADAAVTIRTSSTGRLAVQAGGYLWLYATNFCTARGFIGVEILNAAGGVVRSPGNGDGNMAAVWGVNNANTFVGTGHRHEWQLQPNKVYTLRCRRGYSVTAGNAGAAASTSFQGTALSVTKLGM